MSLVIVGSIGLDNIITPAGEVSDALGGSAVYGALAGSYFGDTYIVGVVGRDYPAKGIDLLKAHGVNLDGLEYQDGKTFRWSGRYDTWNRAETLKTELNVFADFSPLLPSAVKCCQSLMLANIHPKLQLQVLDQIHSYSHIASDTMNYWINLCPDEVKKVVQRVSIVFMNEDEIRSFTGIDCFIKAAKSILALGPKWVIVKRGEYGSVAVSGDDMFFSPAYPLEEVKDPTGAGDTFAGAFMAYLANNKLLTSISIREAIRYGTIMAALNVQDFSVEGISHLDKLKIESYKEQLLKWTS